MLESWIRALTLVSLRVGPGLITPNEIVLDLGNDHLANTTALAADRFELATSILHDHDAFAVAVAIDATSPFVSKNGRFEQFFVLGRSEFGAEASQRLVGGLHDTYIPAAHFPKTRSPSTWAAHRLRASISSPRCTRHSRGLCCSRWRSPTSSWRGPFGRFCSLWSQPCSTSCRSVSHTDDSSRSFDSQSVLTACVLLDTPDSLDCDSRRVLVHRPVASKRPSTGPGAR